MISKEHEIQMRRNALALLEIDRTRLNREIDEITRMGTDNLNTYGKPENPQHYDRIVQVLSRRLNGLRCDYRCGDPIQKYYTVYGFYFTPFPDGDSSYMLSSDETIELQRLGYFIMSVRRDHIYIGKA